MAKEPNGHRLIRQCLNCDTDFRTFPCKVKVGQGKFCGHSCKRSWHSEQARLRNTRVCIYCSNEFVAAIQNLGRGNGKFCSRLCQIAWQSESKRGKQPYEITDANREARRLAKLGKPNPSKGIKRPHIWDEKHALWKGESVTYRTLHSWVVRRLGQPSKCINCNSDGLSGRQIHWANISHDYHRELDDWMRLCARCHRAYDTGKLTLAQIRG